MLSKNQSNLQKFLQTLNQSAVLDWSKKLIKEYPKAEVYLVGGAVRDALLGVKDNKDFDFVVRGISMKNLEKFLGRLGWVEKLGRNFGVLKFKPKKFAQDKNSSPILQNKKVLDKFEPLDIALPRSDFAFNTGGYKDVQVKFDKDLNIEEDLLRRDFTINAIAYNLVKKEIVDPYGGLIDLKNKTIRAVGQPKIRLREDYSRILRAIRLSCQLNFEIEEKTLTAVKKLAKNLNAKNKAGEWITPRETIAKEILRAFYYNPICAFDLCDELNIFKVLMPELLKMKNCTQPANFHSEGDVWQHTKLALEKLDSKEFVLFEKKIEKLLVTSDRRQVEKEKSDQLELILAVIFHDIGKPYVKETPEKNGTDRIRFNDHDNFGADLTKSICERLTFSSPEKYGVEIDNIVKLVRRHMMLINGHPSQFRPTTIEKYFFSDNFPGINLLKLAYLDSLATIPKTGKLEMNLVGALIKRIKELQSLMVHKKTRAQLPAPLLDGVEIMRLLKIKPGKEVGELKEKLREAQLIGKIKNKSEAKKYLQK
ncbi:MAG TPA: HD domain-containing protein [bacterium]|nr:HD domain-containing protein [bacterium]